MILQKGRSTYTRNILQNSNKWQDPVGLFILKKMAGEQINKGTTPLREAATKAVADGSVERIERASFQLP